jgi:hypothetical protein
VSCHLLDHDIFADWFSTLGSASAGQQESQLEAKFSHSKAP